MKHALCLFALFLALSPSLHAQQASATPPVEKVLSQLYIYAQQYIANLPSLSCDESITSQAVKKGKVEKEVKVESTLREIRTGTGRDPFSEQHQFKSVDGHPPHSSFYLPSPLVQGGFANAIDFGPANQEVCFDYQLASQNDGKTLKLDIAIKPDTTVPVCQKIPAGFRRSVLIDQATGRVLYLERRISAEASKQLNEVFFASMEYGPQKMGDDTLWLPIKMTTHDAKDDGRMIAIYSNFHRYTADVKILPVDPPTPPPAN